MQTDYGIAKCSFKDIMDEFGPSVYRLALCKTGNRDLANDIYQQTFLMLLEKKPKFSNRTQLCVWLLKSTQKLAAAHRRCAENQKTMPLEAAADTGIQYSDNFELLDLLQNLNEKYREITVLFYVEDMSVDDISRVLGLSVSAVKSRLMRARTALKKIYKEELM